MVSSLSLCVAARKIVRRHSLGTGPPDSPVADKDVKKPAINK